EIAVLLALLALAVRTGFVPVGGMTSASFDNVSIWSRVREVALHMTIPASALALAAFPIVFQHTRTAINEALEAPFIKAAQGHGVGHIRLLLRHVLPAAANPLISLLGLSIAGLIGSSLL